MESFLDGRPTGFDEDDGVHQECFVTEALELLGFAMSQPGYHRLGGDGMAASELIASAEEAIRASGSLDPAPGSLGSPVPDCADEPGNLKPLESNQAEATVEALLEEEEEEEGGRDEPAVIRQILEAREMEESERLKLAGLLQRLEETALERRRQRAYSSSSSSSSSPAWQRKSGVSQESLVGRLEAVAAAAAATGVSSSRGSSPPLRAAEAYKAFLQGINPRETPAQAPQQQQQRRKPEPAWVRRLQKEEGMGPGEGSAPLAVPAASPWATSSRAARNRAAAPAAEGPPP